MSNFNNKDQAISPKKALVCSMLYIIAADGEVDPQEIGNLLSLVGGENKNGTIVVGGESTDLFRESFDFVKHHTPDSFLDLLKEKNVLTKEQKIFILTNMLDSVLCDGKLEQEEHRIVIHFQQKFGISDAEFKSYYEVILFKNNKTIFKK